MPFLWIWHNIIIHDVIRKWFYEFQSNSDTVKTYCAKHQLQQVSVYDSLSKDSLLIRLIIILLKFQQTIYRNVVSCYSLTLATFEWLIDFNRSHSLVIKGVCEHVIFLFSVEIFVNFEFSNFDILSFHQLSHL